MKELANLVYNRLIQNYLLPKDDSSVALENVVDEGSGQKMNRDNEKEASDVKRCVDENRVLLEKQRMKR